MYWEKEKKREREGKKIEKEKIKKEEKGKKRRKRERKRKKGEKKKGLGEAIRNQKEKKHGGVSSDSVYFKSLDFPWNLSV